MVAPASTEATTPCVGPGKLDQTLLERGIGVLGRLNQLDLTGLKSLIQFWRATGANLPLAEHFVDGSTEAVANLIPSSGNETDGWASRNAQFLFKNTHTPMVVRSDSTAADYLSQMYGDNMRWESIGIFLTASSRASLDIAFFPALYTTEDKRREIIKFLACLGDDCLELCLRLDCLNDLQLVLQYENFIVYSQVYGDQSYHCWRKMGDLASSLYALGYHEKIAEDVSAIPPHICQLRKAALSRIYTGDKSLAIFLGRPPRIVKTYCFLQLPRHHPGIWSKDGASSAEAETETSDNRDMSQNRPEAHVFRDTDPINCIADTSCAALFASLKEEILELFRNQDLHQRVEKARNIRTYADSLWLALPPHFKLTTRLNDCGASPFERDFLVGTRLDYLHTVFLLDLVSLRNIAEPGNSLLVTAREMLCHVVDAIVLRDKLVNSGTCLIWKVALYGLPAAGIVSLALLNPAGSTFDPTQRAEIVQALTVLVTEIRLGAVVGPGEPNFELFTRAIRTMQNLLDTIITTPPSMRRLESAQSGVPEFLDNHHSDDWTPWINAEPWEFELDFWTNLAEHPLLLHTDSGL